MSSSKGESVFVSSRLKGYKGKLSNSIDTTLALASSVALAPGVLFAPIAALASDDITLHHTVQSALCPPSPSPTHTATTHPAPGGLPTLSPASSPAPADLQSDIQLLKSELAGVQCVLAYLQGSEDISTLGKKRTKPLTQEQLRRRAESVTQSLNEWPLRQSGTLPALQQSPGSPARKAATQGGAAPAGGQVASHNSESQSRSAWSAGGVTSISLSSQPSHDTGVATNISHKGFDTLSAAGGWAGAPSGGVLGWKRPAPVTPVGRGEAVILEAALDEALPAGAITAKYTAAAQQATALAQRLAAAGTDSGDGAASQESAVTQRGSRDPPSPAQVLLESQDIRVDCDLLGSVLSEVARQVSAGCAERGRLLLKVAERYQEVFASMAAMVAAVHASNLALTSQLKAERDEVLQQAQHISSLKKETKRQQDLVEQQDFQLKSQAAELEHTRWDMQQEVEKLTQQNKILADEVDSLAAALEHETATRHDALEEGCAELEAQLTKVTDERDDLLARIRFLEKQLVAFRHGASRVTPTANSCIQTDPMDPCEDAETDAGMDMDASSNLLSGPTAGLLAASRTMQRKRPRTNRVLGGFEGMVLSDRQGRIRGLQWTQAGISAIYADKILADTVADRDTRPRMKICEFTFEWHMNRYGLRHLAEVNLVDLIASVRHHAKHVPRVKWFAQFTGLVEFGRESIPDTTPHLSFYLFLLQQLAFPSAIACLFPEHDEAHPPRLSTASMPEVIKAVFRYFNDPEQATAFMAHVDSMAEMDHVDGGSETVLLEPLIRSFMSEYSQRYQRSTTHLKALFLAGDSDRDGLINFDTLVALVDLAAPDATERLKAAIYGESLRTLPLGQHLIPLDTWMAVARTFGLDRWKVDPAALTSPLVLMNQPTGAAQLLAQGPGVLSLLQGVTAPPLVHGALSSPTRTSRFDSSSSMRRLDSARVVDKSIWNALKAVLLEMTPGLPELLEKAQLVLPRGSSMLAPLQQQAAHLTRILIALPNANGDPAIAGLAAMLSPTTEAGGTGGTGPAAAVAPTQTPLARTRSMKMSNGGDLGSAGKRRGSRTLQAASTGSFKSMTSSSGLPGAGISSGTGNGASAGPGVLAGPPDAAQAWCAFHLLYHMLAAALSPTRPASRAVWERGSSGGGASSAGGSRPGSPARPRRMIIQPAMPWRNGRVSPAYPTAAPVQLPTAPPAPPPAPAAPLLQLPARLQPPPAGQDVRSTAGGCCTAAGQLTPEQAQAAIDNAGSLTEAMQAMQVYRQVLEETQSQGARSPDKAPLQQELPPLVAASFSGGAANEDLDPVLRMGPFAQQATGRAAASGSDDAPTQALGIELSHAWQILPADASQGSVDLGVEPSAAFLGFPQIG